MEKFTVVESVVAPLDRANVDTDQIIPKQFLRSVRRSGYGQFLFDEWRYLDRGDLGVDCSTRPKNQDFVLNDARYQGAAVLLARENFGCGSSREHAVWALLEYGFRVIVAPSFGDIFATNALKNGLLPLTLPSAAVAELFAKAAAALLRLRVDLAAQTVTADDVWTQRFDLDAAAKDRLLRGLDDIGATLQRADEICAYEERRRALEPWLFAERRL